MKKNFREWHSQKTDLQENKTRVFFHERDVWFASVGLNIGFEQDGKGDKFLRPVIIVKKFSNEVFWGLPTTHKNKEGKYYLSFEYTKGKYTTAILSQLKLIDSKRLCYKIGSIEESNFSEMKKRLISFLK